MSSLLSESVDQPLRLPDEFEKAAADHAAFLLDSAIHRSDRPMISIPLTEEEKAKADEQFWEDFHRGLKSLAGIIQKHKLRKKP